MSKRESEVLNDSLSSEVSGKRERKTTERLKAEVVEKKTVELKEVPHARHCGILTRSCGPV